jgi:hypothetical protein
MHPVEIVYLKKLKHQQYLRLRLAEQTNEKAPARPKVFLKNDLRVVIMRDVYGKER